VHASEEAAAARGLVARHVETGAQRATGFTLPHGTGSALLADVSRAVPAFGRAVLVPLLGVAVLGLLVGACGLFVSFDYGVSGGRPPDSGLYAVQGTVSGLDHSKVTLALNDVRLTVGDGPFVFPDAVPEGAPFLVSVSEQPVGHPCSLDHAAGTIAGKNADDVVVWCPSDDAQLASLTIDSCGEYYAPYPLGCSGATPLTLAFLPSHYAYEVGVGANTRLRVTVRAEQPTATVRLPGPAYDPPSSPSFFVVQGPSSLPIDIDIDVTAPDRKTVLRYSIAVKLQISQ
jgi:hypothetical protein